MIIIIEGFDNSGKSTLASRLSNELGLERVHPGGPPANIVAVMTRMDEQTQHFHCAHLVNFIYDRVTCISDACYRQNKSYAEIFKFYQDLLVAASKVMLIYCRPSDARLKNFSDHINQEHDTDEIVEHAKSKSDIIIQSYDRLINRLSNDGLFIMSYNFEADDNDSRYGQIVAAITAGKAGKNAKT